MAAPRPDDKGKAPAPRVGLLNRIGNAPWWVAVGLGALLLVVGVYRGETFAQVYGGVVIVLGIVLRVVRRR
jgi:hypothetical protein